MRGDGNDGDGRDDPAAGLRVTEVGTEGPRVVLLHGLFGRGRNFTQVAKALTPELRSVLVDLPNHGASAWTTTVDYPVVAGLVADLLDERYAADGPVHLVGHSMGGKVAMVLALTRPDLVERLVVVDIAPAESSGAGEFEHLLASLAALPLERVVRRSDADELLAPAVPDERVRLFLLQNLRATDGGFAWEPNLALLRRELPTIGGFPEVLRPDGSAATFDGPVLWVAGERSSYVRPEHAAPMRRLFPRTRSVTVRGAGHWVHSERPDAFVDVLRAFLLPRGSAPMVDVERTTGIEPA
ncbi:alpha/beta fold hydrolase [Cellulomonas marina]|uniref:alpha/beta fold hydrolase n=1 Tax=Cellulomonas marina TaxID=988821 RepID=UPI000B7E98CB|nr:alpha/beta fold hydrolase [Cellulomonas marina]GIG29194.1 alpha/beta hydrolase [Cellulomonas marina]